MAQNATKAAIEATRKDDCEAVVRFVRDKVMVEWDEPDTTIVPEDLIKSDMFLIQPSRTIEGGLCLFAKAKYR